jgi:hypothetical protein
MQIHGMGRAPFNEAQGRTPDGLIFCGTDFLARQLAYDGSAKALSVTNYCSPLAFPACHITARFI